MRLRIIGTCFAIAAALAGCGGGNRTVSPQVSAQLVAVVGRIAGAAQARDVAATTAQLADLRKNVLVLRSQNDLSDAAATRILNAADAVQADLRLITPTTTTSTSTTTIASTTTTAPAKPAPPPPPPKHGHGKGHGNG